MALPFYSHRHVIPAFSSPARKVCSGNLRSCCGGAAKLNRGGDTTEDASSQSSSSSPVAPAPLLHALAACASQTPVAPFHFPGHRRGAGAPPSLRELLGVPVFSHDLPELPELDNLFSPQDAILHAQSKAAALFGAQSTFFLVNGSTCGIHAAVMSTCSPGKTLILPRNCHLSAFSAMVLAGAVPKYIVPCYDTEWDLAYGIDPQDLERAFMEVGDSNIGAVLITSPTYHGICSDVRTIAHISHSHGVPLIVDEAHGAHFQFHAGFPATALEQGADVVVQSTHKVLSSLTQSAMLHLQGGRVEKEFVAKCLQTLQSSSPSYLLLASLDAAREHVGQPDGTLAFERARELAEVAREALQQVPGLVVLRSETISTKGACAAMDPLRITVGLWHIGMSGFEVDDLLRAEHNVVAELPSLRSITFAISLGTIARDIESLVSAFQSMSQPRISTPPCIGGATTNGLASVVTKASQECPQCVLSPRQAFFSSSERIGSDIACGRICAELICPYPPGIPLLFPGEIITQGAISYLQAVVQQGGTISGASDSSIVTLLVLKHSEAGPHHIDDSTYNI